MVLHPLWMMQSVRSERNFGNEYKNYSYPQGPVLEDMVNA